MGRAGACLVLATSVMGCHSNPPAAPNPSPFLVRLTLNGARLGSFSCRQGLFFDVSATNLAAHPVQLRSLAVSFTPTAGPASCQAFQEPLDSTVSSRLDVAQTAHLRRFDAAGQLCEAPYGAPECAWMAMATVAADADVASDAIGFETFRPASACDGVVPSLLSPTDGAMVSGTVDVTASVAESQSCVISARTIVEGFSELGSRAFVSGELDLGDRFRWDTTHVPNGTYWLTAFQNCCRTRSAPVVVTVRN